MSSESESDEDYVPGQPEKVSEEESADEETDKQYEKELDKKANKRKLPKESTDQKKRKTRTGCKIVEPESPERQNEIEAPIDAVQEKKKEDDLWAMFLEGTDTKPKSTAKETKPISKASEPVVNKKEEDTKKVSDDDKAREQRIFEFAGETIVVENNKIKEKLKTDDSLATSSNVIPPRGRSSTGGLSSVLGQLNKTNKLSTLEKSKLDWSTYKQDEGIDEEIQSHNRGKNGFLERRDFLERADTRQYEIERDLRLNRRSNR